MDDLCDEMEWLHGGERRSRDGAAVLVLSVGRRDFPWLSSTMLRGNDDGDGIVVGAGCCGFVGAARVSAVDGGSERGRVSICT
ncbi:hypothetical protein RYX36_014582 [Vicia faba]